jgi:predicted TIM-barrel fold metal-dependent hydrolase
VAFDFIPSDDVRRIKQQLDLPVVDGDGHLIEFMPLVTDLVRELAGKDVARRYAEFNRRALAPDQAGFASARVYWGLAEENTLDRLTVTLPQLTYRRLDEIGLDFALLYPSGGLTILANPDDEVRRGVARAFNTYYAQTYDGYRDRLEPVAVVPTFTPEEAVEELEHAVGTLGLKAVVMSGVIPRERVVDGTPIAWIDTLGVDSRYDYDPVWAKCAELGVSPAFHGIGYGWGTRTSPSNYVYNHLGNFATAQEAACRSLFLAGVYKRFPDLRFAFLEGGVAWSSQLLADLLGHYEKRNRDAVRAYDPRRFDLDVAHELLAEFARGPIADRAARYEETARRMKEMPAEHPGGFDDFAGSLVTSEEDIIDVFKHQLFFGCEADDPMNALAFDRRLLPAGTRLNAMFASDIGHWDVRDLRDVLPEAWELVENGALTEDDFADFTCRNVVRMLTATNPSFFEDTVVADAARQLAPVSGAR